MKTDSDLQEVFFKAKELLKNGELFSLSPEEKEKEPTDKEPEKLGLFYPPEFLRET